MQRVKNWLRRYWTLAVLVVVLLGVTYGAFGYFAIDASTVFAIFIPASIGLIGSYGLYLRGQGDNARRLRKAIRSELQSMSWFENWPNEEGAVPVFDPVPSNVYEQNANLLGLLTDREVTHIVEFYSRADITREILGFHRDKTIEADASMFGQDLSKDERTETIVMLLDRLALSHRRALLTVQRRLGSGMGRMPGLTAGQVVRKDHPVVEGILALCVDYGLIAVDDDDDQRFVVTENGEMFFEGELSANDLEKEYDVLRRDEGWLDRVKRGVADQVGNDGDG